MCAWSRISRGSARGLGAVDQALESRLRVLPKIPIAVDVGMEIAKLPEKAALGLGIARVKLVYLSAEQAVEEQ